ncbi:hypothetical protein EUX98_g959 [Antrodiella citrinella]|uniref:Protein-lysine N-methyltransferase EFM4 n=1 Tax=Antrodiella citrinella TaxID=2447956 RepID=A0A4S4N4Z9_9APHY|nr:hypothetical protein EUX98_g959 [Antrodiella citrinella]
MATPVILGVGAIAAAIMGRSLMRRGLIGGKGAAEQWVKGGFKSKMDRKEAIAILGLNATGHCFQFCFSMSDELPSSKLGTKRHWDDVYSTELTNFEEIGDEGEIWFGEDSIEKMVDWIVENVPSSLNPSILEVGSGNGSLLFALQEAGYTPDRICGVDYSEDAVKLAKAVGSSKGDDSEKIQFAVCDFLTAFPAALDADRADGEVAWDLVLDKGTFDAMALAERDDVGKHPADAYPRRIAQVLKPGGHFLIVSCNFTQEELRTKFANDETDLQYHSRIAFPTFSFGGSSGNVYSSVAFHKPT